MMKFWPHVLQLYATLQYHSDVTVCFCAVTNFLTSFITFPLYYVRLI